MKTEEIITPKEKALELVKMFEDNVNPYVGSSMLSDTIVESAILWQSKKCAIKTIDEKIDTCNKFYTHLSFPAEVKNDMGFICFKKEIDYLNAVKTEVENIKSINP